MKPPKIRGGVVLFDGMLSSSDLAEFRRAWDDPSVKLRRFLMDESAPPNRLYGSYIKEDGDAA